MVDKGELSQSIVFLEESLEIDRLKHNDLGVGISLNNIVMNENRKCLFSREFENEILVDEQIFTRFLSAFNVLKYLQDFFLLLMYF